MISQEGRAYRTEVARIASVLRLPQFTGRMRVSLRAAPPDKRRRDLDNILKALLDSLVHANVLADDELVDELTIIRIPSAPPGVVFVTLSEVVR